MIHGPCTGWIGFVETFEFKYRSRTGTGMMAAVRHYIIRGGQ